MFCRRCSHHADSSEQTFWTAVLSSWTRNDWPVRYSSSFLSKGRSPRNAGGAKIQHTRHTSPFSGQVSFATVLLNLFVTCIVDPLPPATTAHDYQTTWPSPSRVVRISLLLRKSLFCSNLQTWLGSAEYTSKTLITQRHSTSRFACEIRV